MYTRIVSFNRANDIDAGVDFVREEVLPLLEGHHGYMGLSASADRPNHVLGVLSVWRTAEDRAMSDTSLSAVRKEAAEVIGGDFTVENYEIAVEEVGSRPPERGCALGVTRTHMDPWRIDEHMTYFWNEVLPEIKVMPGFRALRNMIDRETGDGIVGIAWDDHDALARSIDALKGRRETAASRGVTLGDVSVREILLVDRRN